MTKIFDFFYVKKKKQYIYVVSVKTTKKCLKKNK